MTIIDDGCTNNEKIERLQDYIKALEAERCKIQVFQRELPLCLDLVTEAIERYRQQLSGLTTTEYNLNVQSECNSEQTTSDAPVLEEFIPMKRGSSSHFDDEDEHDSKKNKNEANCNDKNGKKSDWLRSVQLWNQTPDPPPQQGSPKKVPILEVKKNGSCGAFHPFKKEKSGVTPTQKPESKSAPPPPPLPSTSSSAETGGDRSKKGGDKEPQSQRKVRRCWSPELHRRFLQSLQQLGGSHAATPKQIREMMKVDGLTNDEVKSHLQKYRLHTRRPSASTHNNNSSNNNTQQPQFVLVARPLWVPPEYTGMAASDQGTNACKEIYVPIAATPSASPKIENKPSNSEDGGSRHEGGTQSYSPAEASTLTATFPPPQ